MIIAGIDPGIQNTGIAVLKVAKASAELVTFENIHTKASELFENRLKTIYDQLSDFLNLHRPEQIALEEIFVARNIKTSLKLGHARGVALLAAVNCQIPIAEYSPREVKLAVTGNGNASKHQVQQMICRILKLTSIPSTYDITDAMAVAFCHSLRIKFNRIE